ncbi:MAG: hypothetical protein HY674_04690 [Chloroflexi bacterium]|nr:hypothetical protein [Chloroflexota bacterium]
MFSPGTAWCGKRFSAYGSQNISCIAGPGSTRGPLVGAVVLVTLPEALRFIGLPNAVAANLRQIIYGTLLVIMMMFRPRGLVGKYGFSK